MPFELNAVVGSAVSTPTPLGCEHAYVVSSEASRDCPAEWSQPLRSVCELVRSKPDPGKGSRTDGIGQ